jgi:hypothetical protein
MPSSLSTGTTNGMKTPRLVVVVMGLDFVEVLNESDFNVFKPIRFLANVRDRPHVHRPPLK